MDITGGRAVSEPATLPVHADDAVTVPLRDLSDREHVSAPISAKAIVASS